MMEAETNAHGDRYDTSQLTERNRGDFVHRDYAAHFFRWGWAKRHVECGKTRVLDVGCGADVPLARVLRAPGAYPAYYLGVDYNKITRAPSAPWLETLGEFDFTERWGEIAAAAGDEKFDLVVSFESIEHVPREQGLKLLTGARALLAEDGRFLISTPCFNGKAAKAHVHEWEVDELRRALHDAGFIVDRRYGTFASYPTMKKAATEDHLAVLESLRDFYDDDVAACFLAPLYPDASRNNVWVCEGA